MAFFTFHYKPGIAMTIRIAAISALVLVASTAGASPAAEDYIGEKLSIQGATHLVSSFSRLIKPEQIPANLQLGTTNKSVPVIIDHSKMTETLKIEKGAVLRLNCGPHSLTPVSGDCVLRVMPSGTIGYPLKVSESGGLTQHGIHGVAREDIPWTLRQLPSTP